MEHVPAGFTPLPTYKATQDVGNGSSVAVLQPNGVQAWRHEDSGIRIVTFASDGPMVSATIVVGTEPISNGGHAHTLEHLIFLGSEGYPRRGYLDNLACRSLANGTNAWTANEYTAYTTTTAGKEGMKRVLPVLLDHVLKPIIGESGVESEVYCVRGDGSEGGVVFCEMKARGNGEADLGDRALREIIFEKGGMTYEAGGVCEEIRKVKREDVEQFHREQYCGENITVIVGGVGKEVLDWLQIEQVRRGSVRWGRIWGKGQGRRVVKFASSEEDIGSIIMGWGGGGPELAMTVLMRYLAGEVWAPLRLKLVEEECWAGDVEEDIDQFGDGWLVSFWFSGVAYKEGEEEEEEEEDGESDEDDEEDEDDKSGDENDMESEESFEEEGLLLTGKLEAEVMRMLTSMAQTELPGGIEAVRVACRKASESLLTELEGESHDAIPMHFINEVVYGNRAEPMIGQSVRGFLKELEALEKEDESFWQGLIQKHLLDTPHAEVVLVPDAKLADEMAKEEERELQKRRKELGEEGLRRLAQREEERKVTLSNNKFDNCLPSVPDTGLISRLKYKVMDFETSYHAHNVTIGTDFVHATLFLDTSELLESQRVVLPILCELLATCDVLDGDNTYTSFTDHARAVSESTLSTERSGLCIGLDAVTQNCITLHYAAQPALFEQATKLWLKTLFCAEITMQRVNAVAQSLLAEVQTELRDAECVLGAVMGLGPFMEWEGELATKKYGIFASCTPILEFLAREFGRGKPKKTLLRSVIRDLNGVWDAVKGIDDSGVCVQIGGRESEKMQRIFDREWKKMRQGVRVRERNEKKGYHPFVGRREVSLERLVGRRRMGKVVSIAGLERSSWELKVDCEVDELDEDWGGLQVATEMLSRMEGGLCRAVRGRGLAYSVGIAHSEKSRKLLCGAGECGVAAQSWKAVMECIEEFGKEVEEGEVETARASALFRLSSRRGNVEGVLGRVIDKMANGLDRGEEGDRRLEEAVCNVSVEDVVRVWEKYLKKVLTQGVLVVVCGGGEERVVREFADVGVELERVQVDDVCPKVVRKVVRNWQRGRPMVG